MLSTRSAEVVKATLPAVGAAIGDITPIFYRRMFAAHPELERDLFNRGNQAQGDQQSALAGAIAAYATLLVAEDGRDPLDVLARIAHKHASLGITEDQYPIVHKHLFAAIVEVLGDAVTPEVAAAWDEVYWHMAERPGHHREAPVRRGGRRRRRRLAHAGPAPAAAGVAGHRVVRARHAGRQPAAARPPGPVRLGPGEPARRGPPDPAVQPHPRAAVQRLGHHGQGHPGEPHRRRCHRPGRGGVELPAPQRVRGRRAPGLRAVRRPGPRGRRPVRWC